MTNEINEEIDKLWTDYRFNERNNNLILPIFKERLNSVAVPKSEHQQLLTQHNEWYKKTREEFERDYIKKSVVEDAIDSWIDHNSPYRPITDSKEMQNARDILGKLKKELLNEEKLQ